MTRSPWSAILGYYLIGVFAAAQLGKMSALVPLIAAELGLSLTTAAAAISLLEVGGATLGAVAGLLASRLGLKRTLLAGLVCLALAGFGTGMAHSGASLLAWRLLESLGYLGVVVTAPVLIAAAATPATTGVALALWSTFVPVGLALGAWLWAGAAALTSWRIAMFAGGGLALLALAASAFAHVRLPPRPMASAPQARRASPAAWLLAASFGCYTLFEVGLLALLPSYLTSRAGLSVAEAGRWTALASVATVAGSFAAALWLRRGGSLRGPVLVSVLLPAALLLGVFVDRPDARQVAWIAVLLNAISGIYPSLAFAWLPAAAGGVAQMVRANGLIAQFGASGSLLGPPVMAWFVDRLGWPAAAWCGAAVSLPCAWLALRALALTRPPASHTG